MLPHKKYNCIIEFIRKCLCFIGITFCIYFNTLHYWRPRLREGNVFTLSVCLSVQAITFECLDKETSFLVWQDILKISRSSLSTKVIEEGQGHFGKIYYLLLSLC